MQRVARAAAEDILRLIYGDDLAGCTVSLDNVTQIILSAMTGHTQFTQAVADLHHKAYETIRLLSTPPANGQSLSADELRSLLGDRLDKIQSVAQKVIAATRAQQEIAAANDESAG